MGQVIGESTGDELDPPGSRLPSIVPGHVPERVARRRRRLDALRRGATPPDGAGAP